MSEIRILSVSLVELFNTAGGDEILKSFRNISERLAAISRTHPYTKKGHYQ